MAEALRHASKNRSAGSHHFDQPRIRPAEPVFRALRNREALAPPAARKCRNSKLQSHLVARAWYADPSHNPDDCDGRQDVVASACDAYAATLGARGDRLHYRG